MVIKQVIIFANGMVMALDEKGEQVPECQGFILEVAEKLQTACNKDTTFSFADMKTRVVDCNFSWWFINRRGQPPGM